MTTSAKIGHGAAFELFNNDSPGWVTLAEVFNIVPPSLARDAVDASHNQSTQAWRDFIPGLKDGGEVTFELNFIPAGQANSELLRTFNDDALIQCRIVFPDSPATTWTFSGYVTAYEPDAPTDDRMTASVTIKLSGKPGFVT